ERGLNLANGAADIIAGSGDDHDRVARDRPEHPAARLAEVLRFRIELRFEDPVAVQQVNIDAHSWAPSTRFRCDSRSTFKSTKTPATNKISLGPASRRGEAQITQLPASARRG